ncbi:MAG: DUF3592 domain-containing protein [Chloroflexi bacterium]|nr:DUF3592 domain-containing protein [Chloroflexota bacterium]
MSTELIIGIVFTLVGLLLAAIAAFSVIRTQIFLGKAQQVKGTVIRMVYSSDSDGGGYSPIFQFRTITGQTIEVADNLRSNPPMFREGQIVDMLYDPSNPHSARVKKWLSLYFVPLLLGGMGIIFGGIGVVFLIFQLLDMFA